MQALRVALLRAPPNTFFEDTFMWSGEDAFPAAEFPPATKLPNEDAFRRHFSRSRISPRHRMTHRRRFSKTLFPQPAPLKWWKCGIKQCGVEMWRQTLMWRQSEMWRQTMWRQNVAPNTPCTKRSSRKCVFKKGIQWQAQKCYTKCLHPVDLYELMPLQMPSGF